MKRTTTSYGRRLVREKVLQVLYAYELSKEPIATVMDNLLSGLQSHPKEFEFAKKFVHEVVIHQTEIEKVIRSKVAHWEFDRIAVIDKILLKMGICEFLYFPEIPPKVTINEAIEIAKAYSTDKSDKFINGVLDAILSDLKASNTLLKAGRGLLDKSLHSEVKTSKDHES
ncbi:MAG: transcription antitermination factor NusB [Ignavibacteriae bacterium]|nr:transcription antitermination factor NusB [Ignavibacteriota bacterium]